jgi:superfamily II DNA or RNA helicase
MSLAKRCVPGFEARDWRRGADYFQSGAVSIFEQRSDGLRAKVQGTERSPYRVALDWSRAKQNQLLVHCSCPRFDDVGLCKHVAATILAADDQSLGAMIPGQGVLLIAAANNDDATDDASDADDEDRSHEDEEADEAPSNLRGFYRGPVRRSGALLNRASRRALRTRRQTWKDRLASLCNPSANNYPHPTSGPGAPWSSPREIWYLLDIARTLRDGWPGISLRQTVLKKDGTRGKLKTASLSLDEVQGLFLVEDRALLELLIGNERNTGYGFGGSAYPSYLKFSEFAVAPALFEILLPRLCACGRFGWSPDNGSAGGPLQLLAWDDGPPWQAKLSISKTTDKKHWALGGTLVRGDIVADLSSPVQLFATGLVIFPDRIARFDAGNNSRWVALLRQSNPLLVPVREQHQFIERLVHLPERPQIEWPPELRWAEERPTPRPQLQIAKSKNAYSQNLECRLTFQYGDRTASFGDGQAGWYDRRLRRAVLRNLAAEEAANNQLLSAGVRTPDYYYQPKPGQYFLPPQKMSRLVFDLTQAGWHVEAEGTVIRRPGRLTISVTSEIDWFDLEATCDFGDVRAGLPELLAALRRGERYVTLDDGSQGLLPGEWLERYAPLAGLGEENGKRIRFLPTQAAFLDVLLAAQETENVTVDQTFAQFREKLRMFDGVAPVREPRSFVGELRAYQREGLGWLHFLDEFGFGGCLADDMGLGKTIQVLALLDERRQETRGAHLDDDHEAELAPGPSLVVVPRSLIFNWIEEAGRFTPNLRVLNYTGLERGTALSRINDFDLIITTYGTLRRDVAKLRTCRFDYAILDEAQAIKNAASQSAKACRLLNARRRLAMTGTPVENHLGELWSLFEFLNPGMLGRHQKLTDLIGTGRRRRTPNVELKDHGPPAADLTALAHALRPFLLRRTKEQVLSELPPKTEQTLYCELDKAERALYDELRAHYRLSLIDRVNKIGLKKSKIHVLEALLRLRQAASHPGLLDKNKIDSGSSKLETLLEQLAEVIAEGHKALVFSQFTSLLAIIRRQLDREETVYEYLDGRTVNRQARVERFQSDPACRLFLISLKAGGQGLNLTAADYVFILDPWWNPAVEAQAVDRAHRIGQNQHVFAYRLIARDTVEEKILQLQDHKRGLAEAIVSADNSVMRNLTAEDLQLLLS